MLRIRDEQMSAFEQEMARRFARQVVARFRADHPTAAAAIEPSAIDGRAFDAVLAAEALGIRAELDVYLYAKHQLLHGPGFEGRPGFEAARDILADRSAAWSVRLRRLDAWGRRQSGGV